MDGTDVPACYQVASEAVDRARAGGGPTFIEAKLWRINSHTSEDNQARYRTPEELAEAAAHDPMRSFEAWLLEQGWLTAEEAQRIHAELGAEASDAADWAEAQPDPRPEDTSSNVYAAR